MSHKKSKLIKHLEEDIYCRIGISKISGVGVIAIKNIPKNTNPFKILTKNKGKNDDIITLENKDVSKVNKNVVKIIDDFFGSSNKKKHYDVLVSGPNNINISFYMNHSDKPNIDIVEDDTSNYFGFLTNRKILEGEELTINYSKYED